MGLFNPKPVYITDRGESWKLEDMKVSHILNALNHHRKQISTVDWCLEVICKKHDAQNLHLRRIALHNTIGALMNELLERDPDDDHEGRDYNF